MTSALDDLPLAGRTIGVTADRRADAQMKLLTTRGATCLHGPVIQTDPLAIEEVLRDATTAIIAAPPEVMVMTTGLGVRTWLDAADALGLGRALRDALGHVEFVARGAKASSAIRGAGFDVAWMADRYDSVIDRLRERGVDHVSVGLQRDGSGSDDLPDRIVALGATLVQVPVYRWSLPADPSAAEKLITATLEGSVDGLTFTAKPAIEHLFEIAGQMGVAGELAARLADDVEAFCIGPVCAEGFEEYPGIEARVPREFRLAAMVQLIAEHWA